MSRSRLAGAFAGIILIATVLLALGVGQGSPPHALAISPAAKEREIRAVRSGSVEVQRGEAMFSQHGCSDCHSLAAGGYSGRLGPRLDVESQGDSIDAVMQNIEHPPDNDKGYEPGLMPENFGSRLAHGDLRALATYIHAAASAAQG